MIPSLNFTCTDVGKWGWDLTPKRDSEQEYQNTWLVFPIIPSVGCGHQQRVGGGGDRRISSCQKLRRVAEGVQSPGTGLDSHWAPHQSLY